MAHLVGYVGEVTETMLNQPQFEFYNPGDVVGVSGVEKQYNQILMGQNGSRRALVDSRGKEMGRLDETPAVPGKQLKLTVDIDLQIAAEEAMAGKNGAMIAMEPRTGEILAMVSRPTFDPNDFAVRVSRDEWNKLVNDPDKPLLNKAIQAQLAPGSTFKILMSVAGWQENIAQTLNVHCTGGATFYGRRFGCWVKSGHGAVDLPKAISPVTSSSTRWPRNSASTGLLSTRPLLASGRKRASIYPTKPPASCRRKNGRFAISSKNGLRVKPSQWALGRARWPPLQSN
jgi:penicillin-binding protein 2